MKRGLLLCAAACLLLSASGVIADDVVLTLDLRNNDRNAPRSGGAWELFARRAPTGEEPAGEAGIAYIRAIINNISSVGIEFAANIGQMTTGGVFINSLPNGTVEIIYQQDTGGTVIEGVGIARQPHRDRLIASGIWPLGPRPHFADDGEKPIPGKSTAKFFTKTKEIPRDLIAAAKTRTVIVTLGDLNKDERVTNTDIAPFMARLPEAKPSQPFHPAGDIDQSGTITPADRDLLIEMMGESR